MAREVHKVDPVNLDHEVYDAPTELDLEDFTGLVAPGEPGDEVTTVIASWYRNGQQVGAVALPPDRDPEVLMGDRRRPRHWKDFTYEAQLEYVATRMLAEARQGTTSHQEIKKSGILSASQYERRRNREVYSEQGDLDSIKPTRGVFSRTHVRDLRGVRSAKKDTDKSLSFDPTNGESP